MENYGRERLPWEVDQTDKATMDDVRCCVKIADGFSDPFESRRGLRQGDGLSCLLFNVAL